MKCSNCSCKVKKKWNYCPNCGNRLGVFNMVNNILRKFVKGNKSKINIRVRKKNKRRRKKRDDLLKEMNPELEVVEPEVKVETSSEGFKKISMELPGVNKPNQVRIRRAGESLEINALTRDKRYFKILNLNNRRVLKKKLRDDKLTLLVK